MGQMRPWFDFTAFWTFNRSQNVSGVRVQNGLVRSDSKISCKTTFLIEIRASELPFPKSPMILIKNIVAEII